jgi:hypothetical protein
VGGDNSYHFKKKLKRAAKLITEPLGTVSEFHSKPFIFSKTAIFKADIILYILIKAKIRDFSAKINYVLEKSNNIY